MTIKIKENDAIEFKEFILRMEIKIEWN